MSRTLEQIRAGDAYKTVQQLTDRKEDWRKNYVSYTQGLPATILANGLGQAAATLLAAAKGNDDAHKALYRHLEAWLCRDDAQAPYPGQNDLMAAITGSDRHVYIHAQAEAMQWLAWLKKFTVALLKPTESDVK